MTESNQESFERGKVEGRVDQTLDEYGRHFKDINGQVAKLGIEQYEIRLSLNRLLDRLAWLPMLKVSLWVIVVLLIGILGMLIVLAVQS